MKTEEYFWGLSRIALGWLFLWAFLDKTFGLGFSTTAEKAWLSGGSPTTGFLLNATKGPFAEFFQSLAGNPVVDWLFMLGLLLLGISLILGIAIRISAWAGSSLFFLMWLSVLPPANNPFLDEHLLYILLLLGLYYVKAGRSLGLGKWWAKTKLVKRVKWLE